jgi:hypothetical protein
MEYMYIYIYIYIQYYMRVDTVVMDYFFTQHISCVIVTISKLASIINLCGCCKNYASTQVLVS